MRLLYWQKKKLIILIVITVIIVVIVIIHFNHLTEINQIQNEDFSSFNLPDDNIPMVSMSRLETFPETGPDKIPRILHQTWKTEKLPHLYVKWVKSWGFNHPDWEYWFWTDENTREFIAKKYPEFLSVFDDYPEPIRRADAMRYFILYEFGGVYADLDMESLKSLNSIIKKYHCFLGQEPFVHPMIDSNFEHLSINAIMGCRKKHPFMKLLMDQLPKFAHMWHVLDSTGPHFLRLWYEDYKKHNFSPDHINGTYLAPPEYFFPSYDPSKYGDFNKKCRQYEKLLYHQKRACQYLKRTSGVPINLDLAFTHHHWIHTYFISRTSSLPPVDINSLMPHVYIWKP